MSCRECETVKVGQRWKPLWANPSCYYVTVHRFNDEGDVFVHPHPFGAVGRWMRQQTLTTRYSLIPAPSCVDESEQQ